MVRHSNDKEKNGKPLKIMKTIYLQLLTVAALTMAAPSALAQEEHSSSSDRREAMRERVRERMADGGEHEAREGEHSDRRGPGMRGRNSDQDSDRRSGREMRGPRGEGEKGEGSDGANEWRERRGPDVRERNSNRDGDQGPRLQCPHATGQALYRKPFG